MNIKNSSVVISIERDLMPNSKETRSISKLRTRKRELCFAVVNRVSLTAREVKREMMRIAFGWEDEEGDVVGGGG